LRSYRFEPPPAVFKKSLERRALWEPIFELWHRRGKRLGFSENGPLMRVLRHIHLGLGLTGPSPASVRQAIRDFQRRGGVHN